MNRRRRAWLGAVALSLGASSVTPGSGVAQGSDQFPIGLDITVGVGKHGGDDGPCDRDIAASLGLAAQSRGPVVLGGSVEISAAGGSDDCQLSVPLVPYMGQSATFVDGSAYDFSPRLGAVVGYRIELSRGWLEPVLRGGVVRTNATRDVGPDEDPWNPWFGVAISGWPSSAGLGARLEYGRHRTPRYFFDIDGIEYLGTLRDWQDFWTIGLTVALH